MNREEINKVFDYLEREMNKHNYFYFLLKDNEVFAYWKSDKTLFATFYPDKILNVIEYEKENK